jgi:hypothetical protein
MLNNADSPLANSHLEQPQTEQSLADEGLLAKEAMAQLTTASRG